MKIQYCSDLHMEFPENRDFVNTHTLNVTGEVLVVAGDVGYLNAPDTLNLPFWEWASANYREVLIVPGNHEFYNKMNLNEYVDEWKKMLLHNVGFYHNKVIRIEDTDFILSTLWTKIPPAREEDIQNGMNDYYHILYSDKPLSPYHINEEFERNILFIKDSVSKSTAEKIVVVTHHIPSFKALLGRRKNDELNSAYATELDEYICGSRISAWIYGHNHYGTDLMIGATRLVSNPLGYVSYGQHIGFDNSAMIEV